MMSSSATITPTASSRQQSFVVCFFMNHGGCWRMVGIIAAAALVVIVALSQQQQLQQQQQQDDPFSLWRSDDDNPPGTGQPDVTVARRLVSLADADDGQPLLPLFPIRTVDVIGFLAAIVGLMLSACGGIGGGGLLVPTFTLIMGFPVKHAVSLSNVTVFGGAIANTLLNAPKRHPIADRPLIDWNLLAMMEPLTMAGALIGADITELLPDVVIVILLVALLGFTTVKTLQKANQLHAAETTAQCKAEEKASLVRKEPEGSNGGTVSYGTDDSTSSGTEKHSSENAESRIPTSSSDLALLLEEEARIPWHRIFQMVGLFLTVVILNLLKGSGDSLQWLLKVDIRCGSMPFFLLEKATLVVIVVFSIYIRQELIRNTTKKQQLSYTFADGDVIWDNVNTLKYTALCSCAGLFAGLFGIGGGIVKSPLMLEMGVPPSVAAATSATMILFTSFTATSSFVVFGQLNYQYAAVCVVLGFISTLAGQLAMQAILTKSNRASYIAYSIALVVGISAAAMSVESVLALADGHTQKGAGGMCSSFGV